MLAGLAADVLAVLGHQLVRITRDGAVADVLARHVVVAVLVRVLRSGGGVVPGVGAVVDLLQEVLGEDLGEQVVGDRDRCVDVLDVVLWKYRVSGDFWNGAASPSPAGAVGVT